MSNASEHLATGITVNCPVNHLSFYNNTQVTCYEATNIDSFNKVEDHRLSLEL